MTTKYKVFADSRLLPECIYCGEKTENRDHSPAKVFLDEPYPPNLVVINSCIKCNEGASMDEQYVACVIEVASKGTLNLDKLRSKIKRTLEGDVPLYKKLEGTVLSKNPFEIGFDNERVERILLKLAKGHAAYELSENTDFLSSKIEYCPIHSLSENVYEQFETLPEVDVFPELGSRGMQRLLENSKLCWLCVQPSQYRFAAFIHDGVIVVRIVISEYLAVQVTWEDN